MDPTAFLPAAKLIRTDFSIQFFEKFVLNSNINMEELSSVIKNCKVDEVNCRFNIWRLCLGVINYKSTLQEKRQQLNNSRRSYQQKKQQVLKVQTKRSPIKQQKKNPLMMMNTKTDIKDIQSDQFLKQQIQKDVDRTYQEMKFFLDKNVGKLLSLILFVWCRKHTDVSYKQGMNELLASVVVCYFQQAQFKSTKDKPEDVTEQLWENHLFFNSAEYAEADIYNVFEKIINIQGDMYKTQADQDIKTKVNPNSKNNTPILQRIMQIKDHKLKHLDLQLFRIIKLQDVQTKSFMLRWIRCMHTREFSLQNSFVIWDSIFLEYLQSPESKKKGQFQFIDAMCLAMFMYMRSIVLKKQTAGEILQVYQKYPPLKRGEYLDQLIMLAWTLCEELRTQSNQPTHHQNNSTNWFEESEKVKKLEFLNKKTQSKTQTQAKVELKKNQTIEVQKNIVQPIKKVEVPSKSATPVVQKPQNLFPKHQPFQKSSPQHVHKTTQKNVKPQPPQKQSKKYPDLFIKHIQPIVKVQQTKHIQSSHQIKQHIKTQAIRKHNLSSQIVKQKIHFVKGAHEHKIQFQPTQIFDMINHLKQSLVNVTHRQSKTQIQTVINKLLTKSQGKLPEKMVQKLAQKHQNIQRPSQSNSNQAQQQTQSTNERLILQTSKQSNDEIAN